MTKSKTFQMRVTPEFMDSLEWLAREMGVSKALAVEVAVNTYPAVIKMMQKHEVMLAKLKNEI